jgi:hypothetical protein
MCHTQRIPLRAIESRQDQSGKTNAIAKIRVANLVDIDMACFSKAKALNLIQQDWFKIAAQKNADAQVVMDHLNAFYARFSNLLLERIVNMADMNVSCRFVRVLSTSQSTEPLESFCCS